MMTKGLEMARTRTGVYKCLYKVFKEANCLDLLKIICDTSPEKSGINFIGLSLDTYGMVSYIRKDRFERATGSLSNITYEAATSYRESFVFPNGQPETGIIMQENPLSRTERQKLGVKTSIGKLLNKFVDINKYQKEMLRLVSVLNQDSFEIHVVEGERVRELYLCDNYHENSGTALRSCMSHHSTQEFLDLYAYNPDVVKMAVLRHKSDPDNIIRGRALLWQNVSIKTNSRCKHFLSEEENYGTKNALAATKVIGDGISGAKYMDRIYCCPTVTALFSKFAMDNNYFSRGDATRGFGELVSPKNEAIDTSLINMQTIIPEEHHYFPYMDTFGYGSQTSDGFVLCSDNGDRYLQKDNGCVNDGYCDSCGESFDYDDDDYYVDAHGNHYCSYCGDTNLRYVDSEGEYYDIDEVSYCEICDAYELIENINYDVISSTNDTIAVCSSCLEDGDYVYIEKEDKFYHSSLVSRCDECDSFEVNEEMHHLIEVEKVVCQSCFFNKYEPIQLTLHSCITASE